MTDTILERLSLHDLNQLPHVEVPELEVFDYDRTLGRVDVAVQRLYAAAAVHDIDQAAIESARQEVENDGGSFSPLSFMRDELTVRDDISYPHLCGLFLTRSTSLLYEDAPVLLDTVLSDPVTPHLVLTAGVDPEWQELKVRASGYTGHTEIMRMEKDEHGIFRSSAKGPELAKWIGANGTFDVVAMNDDQPVAVLHAETAQLVDDKVSALQELPAQAHGVLIQRAGEKRTKSQLGEVSEDILVVSSLVDFIPHMTPPSPAVWNSDSRVTHFVPVYSVLGHNT